MASVLDELSAAVGSVAAAAGPAVVGVGRGGSGVVVGAGLVATNAHNLRAEAVTVVFADGRRAEGESAGVDADGDLAVVRVDTGDVPVPPLAGAVPVAGQAVVALANPAGRGLRVSLGLVSAVDVSFRGPGGRIVTGAFEHTAPLARGSSGGPVVDAAGAVVGIDTHRIGEGFYLAIPTAGLSERIASLARGEVPRRPRLGIAVAPPRVARRLRASVGLPEREGLLVHAAADDGPAARAGIRQGDLIVAVGGTPVADADQLAAALEASPAGQPVAVTIVRGVEERVVSVDLEAA
jgi:serine protease Do